MYSTSLRRFLPSKLVCLDVDDETIVINKLLLARFYSVRRVVTLKSTAIIEI